MRLLVIVPCRDESAVVARRLANLSRCVWPASAQPHRIVVVDDHSQDRTVEQARAAAAQHFAGRADVEVLVRANLAAPGKPAAVRAGLDEIHRELRGRFDLVVLTDADVAFEERALIALVERFLREPRLALACGAQRFVRDLAADGSLRAADGGALRDASQPWDRWTARVRALESRLGLVFSVHGQLLAWRVELGLAPTLGVAADDIDLMLQVRALRSEPRRVELVPRARFAEVKTPPGAAGEEQAARRARAWFQALWRPSPPAQRAIERVQWRFYRHAPGLAPALTVVAAVAIPLAAAALWGFLGAVGALLALALLSLTKPARRWMALMVTIARAARRERRAPLPDGWGMSRT